MTWAFSGGERERSACQEIWHTCARYVGEGRAPRITSTSPSSMVGRMAKAVNLILSARLHLSRGGRLLAQSQWQGA